MEPEKRFLVFGANGLVGRAVGRRLTGSCTWTGTCHKRVEPGLVRADVTSDSDLARVFDEVRPDYVVNAANLAGGVDFCEHHPDLAEDFHLKANISMGKLCRASGARILMISTDYVFDGENPPYQEDDKTNPLNVYGRLKLEAERWLAANVARYTVVRTTNVFGWDPASVTPNYMMNLYNTVRSGRTFRAPSFLWGNPTYAGDLADAIIELCARELNGIFHVVGGSYINRFDWSQKACRIIGLDGSLVEEVKDVPENIVPRPLKSNLDTAKFRGTCWTRLKDVDEGLRAFVRDMGQP